MKDQEPEEHTLLCSIRSPFVWAPHDDEAKVLARLIGIKAQLSSLVQRQEAWGIVTETTKKIALWLSAMAGRFLVLSETLYGLPK